MLRNTREKKMNNYRNGLWNLFTFYDLPSQHSSRKAYKDARQFKNIAATS